MNLEHLQLFVRIASTKNISAAGKELGLSAAVASAHMNKLERDLGVALLHRTTRSISLTEDGEALLPHAQTILDNVDNARAVVGSSEVSPRGTLRITASASFGRMHLLPGLPAFLARFPDLKIDLHLSDRLVDIVEGGFDIAFRDAALPDSSLIARQLAPVQRILCASPDYLAVHGQLQSPNDLYNHACISLHGLENWTLVAQDNPEESITIKPNSILRVDHGESARDAAVQGLGITVCSTWCCYKEIHDGTLTRVLPRFSTSPETAIWVVYPKTHIMPPKVRALIDYFVERFGTSPYWEMRSAL